jgi:hypothetical protein
VCERERTVEERKRKREGSDSDFGISSLLFSSLCAMRYENTQRIRDRETERQISDQNERERGREKKKTTDFWYTEDRYKHSVEMCL